MEQSTEPVAKKKSCTEFKDECLREIVEVEMPNLCQKQKVILGQIFVHQELAALSAVEIGLSKVTFQS